MHGCSKENFCLICGERKNLSSRFMLGRVRSSQYADMVWVFPVLHSVMLDLKVSKTEVRYPVYVVAFVSKP